MIKHGGITLFGTDKQIVELEKGDSQLQKEFLHKQLAKAQMIANCLGFEDSMLIDYLDTTEPFEFNTGEQGTATLELEDLLEDYAYTTIEGESISILEQRDRYTDLERPSYKQCMLALSEKQEDGSKLYQYLSVKNKQETIALPLTSTHTILEGEGFKDLIYLGNADNDKTGTIKNALADYLDKQYTKGSVMLRGFRDDRKHDYLMDIYVREIKEQAVSGVEGFLPILDQQGVTYYVDNKGNIVLYRGLPKGMITSTYYSFIHTIEFSGSHVYTVEELTKGKEYANRAYSLLEERYLNSLK